MTEIAEKLDRKLSGWNAETALQVTDQVDDTTELADSDAGDILPSRALVQEVLDFIDRTPKR